MPKAVKRTAHIDRQGVDLDAELARAVKALLAHAQSAMRAIEQGDLTGVGISLEMTAEYVGGAKVLLERIHALDTSLLQAWHTVQDAMVDIDIFEERDIP